MIRGERWLRPNGGVRFWATGQERLGSTVAPVRFFFWRQTYKRGVYNPIHRTIALNGVTILRNVECTATTPQNWRQSWSLWSRPMWQNQLRHDPCDLWPTTHHRLLKNFIRHNKNSNGKFKKKQKKRKYNDNATPILCVANAYTTIGLLCCTDLARWCYCHNYANYY